MNRRTRMSGWRRWVSSALRSSGRRSSGSEEERVSHTEPYKRPDYDLMTPAEIDALTEAEIERNRREHADDPPLLEYNRAKWESPFQFEFTGYSFNMRPGFLIICDTPSGRRRGENVGLVSVSGGGSVALVVLLEGERRERWALWRADGEEWASTLTAFYSVVPERWVPVLAWPVSESGSISEPVETESWTVFTPARYVPEDAEWYDDLRS